MKSGLLLLLFPLLSYAATDSEIDRLIDEIFKSKTTTVASTGSCECIPYYLCKNNTIERVGYGVIDIRVQDESCDDYLSVCCNPRDKLPEPTTPPPMVYKSKGCGVRNPDGIGVRTAEDKNDQANKDNQAKFGEFPWAVAVLLEEAGIDVYSNKLLVYQCGASLIHPQVVLTSAHCVNGDDKVFIIRAGEWDVQTKTEPFAHQDRDVEAVIIHPEYHAGALYNDVALLIINGSLQLAENVDTICLPKQGQLVENTRCYASGWGKDVAGKEGRYQVILKKIELPIVPKATCEERLRTTRLRKYFHLHESFICAGGEVGRDTCKGDGGSPLVCPIPGQPGKYFQAGIVSWGIGCGETKIPAVYANVAQFSNWIDDQLASNQLETSYYTY